MKVISRSYYAEKIDSWLGSEQIIVLIGQLRAGEIDFVCTCPRQRVYVQVAWLVDSESTFRREFGALQAIGDDYPKYVISATPMLRSANHEGITHLHLRQFLKEGFSTRIPH